MRSRYNRPMQKRWLVLLEVFLLVGVMAWVGYSLIDRTPVPINGVKLKFELKDARSKVFLVHEPDGKYSYVITRHNGKQEKLSPEKFADRIYEDQQTRGWLYTLLNITSPVGIAWVTIGLLGQVLFTGRMIVQWIASEKKKESVVPPMFWWMSLVGATMLLIYFLWRRDAVGVLGQTFGWFIYIRNLLLIYGKNPTPALATEDPAPEPELNK
jgi:lipid-A-disaccharide synthase-like uncharacterized protein